MSGDDLTDDESDRLEKDNARRDVVKLVLIGVVLVVVGGIGVWFSRWDSVEFDIVEMVDDRTLIVWYGCNGSYRSHVQERDDEVEITLDYRPPGHDEDCLSSFRIELDDALGDRNVVDHRTGRTALIVPYSG